jgi:hypothetical protein
VIDTAAILIRYDAVSPTLDEKGYHLNEAFILSQALKQDQSASYAGWWQIVHFGPGFPMVRFSSATYRETVAEMIHLVNM